jgi:putative membrane protein insertion efficiency factor
VIRRVREVAWRAGWPARFILAGLIRLYRATLGSVLGGGCRFYPSCSSYAEHAIREVGVIRGSLLAVWRMLRCSPLTAGGVDLPPGWWPSASRYDADIRRPDVIATPRDRQAPKAVA